MNNRYEKNKIETGIKMVEVYKGYTKEEIRKEIRNQLRYLPKRFHEEFVCDLLCSSGPQTIRTIQKNWEMYWETIYNELSRDEKEGYF